MQELGEVPNDAVSLSKSLKVIGDYGRKFGQSGFLPDESRYVDAMQKFDGRPAIREQIEKDSGVPFSKALYIGGLSAGTQDKTLIPIYVDPTIVDQTRRLTPLIELVPRVTNYGKTADYNYMNSRGTVGWRNEDAALNEANETYTRASTSIRYLYSVGRVTGPMIAASRQYLSQQYIDALNLEVRQKTITLRYMEEDTLLSGNNSASRTAWNSNTTISGAEPTGMRNLITTTATDYTATPNISIPTIRTLVRAARTAGASATLGQGDPNLMVTDWGSLDNIKALLQEYQRYVNINYEIAWGLKTLEFEGLPILASRFMPETTGSREILVLSTDTWQMRVLQDVTYEELAKTNDSIKFSLKLYEAPICTAEMFNARGYNFT